jgi:hypothetical protein
MHVHNSLSHNGQIETDEIVIKMLERVPNPACSPDVSQCNFWLFGTLKQKITDRMFWTPEDALTTI